jgi:hypothetical protein
LTCLTVGLTIMDARCLRMSIPAIRPDALSYRTGIRLVLAALQVAGIQIFANSLGPPLFGVVALCAGLFAGSVAIIGIGRLRTRTLVAWAMLCVPLTSYIYIQGEGQSCCSGGTALLATFVLLVEIGFLVFVCHAFVVAADTDRRWLPSYAACADVAWRLATEALLINIGVALLWIGILLGAKALSVRSISGIADLGLLANGAMVVAILHVADRRPAAIERLTGLLIAMLSWLLPVVVIAIVATFSWNAISDASRLWSKADDGVAYFAASFGLVLLINAQLGTGSMETGQRGILVTARHVAVAILPLLFAWLVAFGVREYIEKGWTPYGIGNAEIYLVLGFYAIGYPATALALGALRRGLPAVNIAAALTGIALAIGTAFPLSNANRLAVDHQLERLASGRVSPEKFDYDMLYFDAGPYGREALERLSRMSGTDRASEIARRAQETLRTALQSDLEGRRKGRRR